MIDMVDFFFLFFLLEQVVLLDIKRERDRLEGCRQLRYVIEKTPNVQEETPTQR
jgi:hypothetical protein